MVSIACGNRQIHKSYRGRLAKPFVPGVIHHADDFINGAALDFRKHESLTHRVHLSEEVARRRFG